MTNREALVSRWIKLTRDTLPGMATAQRWPIKLDHCFMRVFLDQAMGGQWDAIVARPAIRNMDVSDLARAIAMAETVVDDPALLPGLNAQSLAWRAAQRRRCRAGAA